MLLSVDIEKRMGSFRLRSSFTVDGECLALLGASGCGKTMTLRCIAGIEKPDRGRITLGDRVLFDSEKKVNLPARERGVGYLFQNYALFPNMTVRQNVTCVAKDLSYAEELLERFCLSEVAELLPAELSGGQSQRTALARMLATKPAVLLLDEPFSALDNYLRTRIEHEILDLLEDFQGPSVLVTHDRNEAYRLGSRIGVMDDGNVVELRPKEEFFDRPQTVAAARLTGCKNISRLEKGKDGGLWAADWGIALPKQDMADPPENRVATHEATYEATYVGYRAHYFGFAGGTGSGQQDTDTGNRDGDVRIQCRTKRVIHDTFSVVICFTVEGNLSEDPDALLTWIVDNKSWETVKDAVESGSFGLELYPEKLMWLSS